MANSIKQKQGKVVKVLLYVATLGLLTPAINAEEKERGFYIGVGVGKSIVNRFKSAGSYQQKKPKDNIVPSLAFGYRFDKILRADINGQMRKFKYSGNLFTMDVNQNIDNKTMFLNAYLDMPTDTVFTPYATIGFGYSINRVSKVTARDQHIAGNDFNADGVSKNTFTWNAGCGLLMKAYENIDLNLSYRYIPIGQIGSLKADDGITPGATQKLKIHSLSAELVYKF